MRVSKKVQKRTDKAISGLNEFLLAMGKSEDEIKAAWEAAPMDSDGRMLQAEAVLAHLNKPSRFITKTCKRKECGERFSTNYQSVAYCSDNCRGKDLEAQTGIRWNPHVDRYRNLNAERPLIIGPEAHKVLVEFAHRILEGTGIVVQQTDQTHQQSQQPPKPDEHFVESLPEQEIQSKDDPQTSPEFSLPPLSDFSLPDLGNPSDL